MANSTEMKRRLEDRLFGVVDEIRPDVIDAVELRLGSDPNWKFLRSKLLNSFGERGLRGKIQNILDAELGSEAGL